MSFSLSKTQYQYYRACPEELWLMKNQPELFPPMNDERQFSINQGNLVDAFVEKLFADKAFLKAFKIGKRKIEFQKRVYTEGYLAIADVVVFDETEPNCIDLFEVKGSKEVKDEYLHDLAFQKFVFEKNGLRVRKTYLVHINPTYVFDGELDAIQFFRLPNVSDKVDKLMPATAKTAAEALAYINNPTEPEAHFKLCGNKLDCVFLKKHFPDLPYYTVFDIRNIREKKLNEFLEKGILDIADVPIDFPLSDNQRRQVNIAQSQEIVIDKAEIHRITEGWEPPFYFLDYETINLVFPIHPGLAPYQQMVFQYSLHVLDLYGNIQHYEFLIDNKTDAPIALLTQLQKDIQADCGTVFVWNKSFEKTRNEEMARMYPAFADFLNDVNTRMYDLEVPFKSGVYIHPDFKGKSSIKKVLPVLAPDLSYNTLTVQNGSMAFTQWSRMIFDDLSAAERQQIRQGLLDYCKMDTWAMVRIWEVLKNTGTRPSSRE
jgi:CRISPR/Cas system-associated exonuclease Cas4 (RecB family)